MKNWLALIRLFFLAILCFIAEQQLLAQVGRGRVNRDATNQTEKPDTISEESTDSTKVFELSYQQKYKGIQFTKSLDWFNYQNVDTLFELEHQFDPVNKTKYRYNNIGIIGSPVYDLLPEFTSRLNFDLGFNQFKPYQTNADSIAIYKVNAPFTKLSWRFGSKMQQLFNVLHVNRIKNVLQFGISLNRISSGEGFYAKQRVRNNGLDAYATYNSKSKRYKIITTLNTYKYVLEQNGGLNETEATIGEIFGTGLSITSNGDTITAPETRPHFRNTEDVNLQNAFSRNNGLNIAVNQYLNFGKYFNEAVDTDSTFIKRFVPQFRLKHKLAFVKDDHIFEDNATFGNHYFYPDTLLNQTGFYIDSLKSNKWLNQLALIQTGNSAYEYGAFNLPFKSMLSINYEHLNIKRLYLDTVQAFTDTLKINNIWLALNLSNNNTNKPLSYSFNAEYGLGAKNYQGNKYLINAALSYQLPEELGKIGINYTSNRYNAPLIYTDYKSNFYRWQNKFEATKINSVDVNYTNPQLKLGLKATASSLKNVPYFFYDDAIDTVNLANGNLYRIQLQKAFTFGWWKMRHQLVYQTINNTNIYLPNWLYYGSFYYSGNWFKQALSFNAGFELRYFSTFNLPYYNPVTGQFYNQNQLSNIQPYTQYPAIDFFINCKIQTAVLFFKVEYLNQNWFQRGYYTAVNYPTADYTFRGGVSWRFFD